jgi:Tol biopolymer transport system component
MSRSRCQLLAAGLLAQLACQSPSEPAMDAAPAPPASAWPPGRLVRTIAFVSDRDGNAEVYAMTVLGTQQINLSQNPADDLDPSWSPDGTKVVFVRRSATGSEIWLMSSSGTGQVQLSHTFRDSPAYAGAPRWSPDGSRIVFLRSASPNGWGDLYVISAAGGLEKKLTTGKFVVTAAAWSPDGTQLAFVRGYHLYRINADGTGLTALAPASVYVAPRRNPTPCWAPGPLILYTNLYAQYNVEVYAIHPSGGIPIKLTEGHAPALSACWSPDASSMVVSYFFDAQADILVPSPGGPYLGGGWKNLTENPIGFYSEDRGFSPDGSLILFHRNVTEWEYDAAHQVWTMKADGTGQVQLTTAGSNYDPAWR